MLRRKFTIIEPKPKMYKIFFFVGCENIKNIKGNVKELCAIFFKPEKSPPGGIGGPQFF